jgi:predicted nucleic acid-binding protein
VRLAGELGHPIYDCLYLALAIREGTYVVTADSRFANALSKHPTLSGSVRLLEQVA